MGLHPNMGRKPLQGACTVFPGVAKSLYNYFYKGNAVVKH